MKIAVIGAGAMGSIYGGHLSLQNEVWLVDTNREVVEHIQKNGLILQENGQDITYHPSAVTSAEGLPHMDLVILFVKALYSQSALSANRELIGPDTFLMTLLLEPQRITERSLLPVMCAGAALEKQISACLPEIPADFFQRLRKPWMPADFRDRFIPTSSSLSGTSFLPTYL